MITNESQDQLDRLNQHSEAQKYTGTCVEGNNVKTKSAQIITKTISTTTPKAKTHNSLQDWFVDEMTSSAIARDVAELNFSLIDGYEAFTEFAESCNSFDSSERKKYSHIYMGGFGVYSRCPQTDQVELRQFKPINPRIRLRRKDKETQLLTNRPDKRITPNEVGYFDGTRYDIFAMASMAKKWNTLPKNHEGKICGDTIGYWSAKEKYEWIKDNRLFDVFAFDTIKYETPKGTGTPIIFPFIPNRIIDELNNKDKKNDLSKDNYWQDIKNDTHIPVWITEGNKKGCSLISHHEVSVSSFSITTHSEAKKEDQSAWDTELKPELKWLLEKGKRKVYIAFDACDVKESSRKNVRKQTILLGKKLEKLGCKPYVVSWNDTDCKGIDDYIAKYGQEGLQEIKKQAKPLNKSDAYKQWIKEFKEKKLNELINFTSQITFNEKYISKQLLNLNIENKIIGVRSPKNTGKTYSIHEIKKKYPDKHILLITHRTSLTSHISKELGLLYLDNNVTFVYAEEWLNNQDGIGLVIDSILKTKDIDYSDLIVVIDEAEQVLNHLLTSPTHIEKIRGQAMALLAEKLPQAFAVLLFDSDLSNRTCHYWQSLAKKELIKIENKFINPVKRNATIYGNIPDLLDYVESQLQKGNKLILPCDDKTLSRAIYERFGNNYKCVNLNADSIIDDNYLHIYFDNHGEKIVRDEIDLFIYSPIAQSGISWELEQFNDEKQYFSEVIGIFTGNVDPFDACQMLRRYRALCDLRLFVEKHGKTYSNNFDWQEINKSAESAKTIMNDSIEYAEYLRECSQGNDDLFQFALSLLTNQSEDKEILNLNKVHKAMLKARRNLLMSDYKEITQKLLEQENYEVTSHSDINPDTSIFDVKNEILIKDAGDIQKADNLDDETAKKLNRQRNLVKKDRDALSKYFLLQACRDETLLQGESGINFIFYYLLKNRLNILKGIKNYVISQDDTLPNLLDKKAVNYRFKQAINDGGIFWQGDIKSYSVLAKIFANLGLKSYLDINSPSVLDKEKQDEFISLCKKNQNLLDAVGIRINKKPSFKPLFDSIVNLYGFTSELKKRSKTERFYVAKPLIPNIINQLPLDESTAKLIWTKVEKAIKSHFETQLNTLSELENPLENRLNKNQGKNLVQTDTEQENQPVTKLNCILNKQEDFVTSYNKDGVRDTAQKVAKKGSSPDCLVQKVSNKSDIILNDVTEKEGDKMVKEKQRLPQNDHLVVATQLSLNRFYFVKVNDTFRKGELLEIYFDYNGQFTGKVGLEFEPEIRQYFDTAKVQLFETIEQHKVPIEQNEPKPTFHENGYYWLRQQGQKIKVQLIHFFKNFNNEILKVRVRIHDSFTDIIDCDLSDLEVIVE